VYIACDIVALIVSLHTFGYFPILESVNMNVSFEVFGLPTFGFEPDTATFIIK
jgi:hypothetical protein